MCAEHVPTYVGAFVIMYGLPFWKLSVDARVRYCVDRYCRTQMAAPVSLSVLTSIAIGIVVVVVCLCLC